MCGLRAKPTALLREVFLYCHETPVALSHELARLVDDAAFIESVVEDARGQAWSELGDAIESRLALTPAYQPDADYALDRDTRLRELLAIDLAQLERTAGKLPRADAPERSLS